MADDQKPKTMDINDLVRELSKSSTSPSTPPPMPQPSRPPFPTSPSTGSGPSAKPSVPVTPVRPQFNVPPKPVPPPVAPPSVPGVKEYQSSIRTMNEDISKLKQGQRPTGIDVPRKVEQVVPAPQPIPPQPAPPTGGPSPQFKVPSVNLGEAQKTGPLAQSRDIPKPPVAPKVETKPQIYIPQEGQQGGNRNMLFIGIGAIAIVAGFSYWFFVLRSPAPELVQETPTPTLTPTATPIQDLGYIFSNVAIQGVGVVDPVSDLSSALSSTATEPINVNGGEFVRLNIRSETKGQVLLGLLDFLTKPKQELIDSFSQDSMVLLYGQKEIFDSKGQLKTNAAVEKRLVFINEVKDSVSVSQLGRAWETEMTDDFKIILQFDSKKQASQDFADNSYKGVSVRYKNFQHADKTIDYAVVTASNNKSYLVIAGSREAIYATIDKLKGF